MQKRLWFLQISLVVMIILGSIALVVLTGGVASSDSTIHNIMKQEFEYAKNGITQHFGGVITGSTELAKDVSLSMEQYMSAHGLTLTELNGKPEVIEEILTAKLDRSIAAMQIYGCSGVYIVLDATVNSNLPHAEYSRAGFYIKNTEANVVAKDINAITMLRGSLNLANTLRIPLHALWDMEFFLPPGQEHTLFYYQPLQAVKQNDKPVSALGYWSPVMQLSGKGEPFMVFSVPLIDSKGQALGVCGLEITNHLFKLLYRPSDPSLMLLFSPLRDNEINTADALYAGSYSARLTSHAPGTLLRAKDSGAKKYSQYHSALNPEWSLGGLEKELTIYPTHSVFADKRYSLAVVALEKDIVEKTRSQTLLFFGGIGLIFCLGVAFSYTISKKYISPITMMINQIKNRPQEGFSRTHIPEIDDLIDFLEQKERVINQALPAGKSPPARQLLGFEPEQVAKFARRIKTLSEAERKVFDLYTEGYNAQQICGILFLSINTIKTHNKRIYAKLEINSRTELFAYVQELKKLDSPEV